MLSSLVVVFITEMSCLRRSFSRSSLYISEPMPLPPAGGCGRRSINLLLYYLIFSFFVVMQTARPHIITQKYPEAQRRGWLQSKKKRRRAHFQYRIKRHNWGVGGSGRVAPEAGKTLILHAMRNFLFPEKKSELMEPAIQIEKIREKTDLMKKCAIIQPRYNYAYRRILLWQTSNDQKKLIMKHRQSALQGNAGNYI